MLSTSNGREKAWIICFVFLNTKHEYLLLFLNTYKFWTWAQYFLFCLMGLDLTLLVLYRMINKEIPWKVSLQIIWVFSRQYNRQKIPVNTNVENTYHRPVRNTFLLGVHICLLFLFCVLTQISHYVYALHCWDSSLTPTLIWC